MKKIPPLTKKNRRPEPDSMGAALAWDRYSAGDAGTIFNPMVETKERLETAVTRLKAAGSVPTATWGHGPGGTFSVAGLGGKLKPVKDDEEDDPEDDQDKVKERLVTAVAELKRENQ